MSGIRLIANDIAVFRDDIGRFEETVTKMDGIRQRIFNEINLLGSMWEGAAHDSLMSRFSADHSFTEKYIAFLRGAGDNYRKALEAYARCEEQVEELIASMNLGEA